MKTCLHMCSANKVLSTLPRTGIKNMLARPIDKMLCIYLLCPYSEHQNNPFQSKQSKHFHQRKGFTPCEAGSNKVKLPKVGSYAMVPVRPNKLCWLEGAINKPLEDKNSWLSGEGTRTTLGIIPVY